MIRKIFWKFDEDPTWFRSDQNLGLGGHWEFLTGDLEDGVIFDIINHVSRSLGRYPESLMKIRQDLDMAWIWTWRTLRVPDWRLGGWGHLWHNTSCQNMIRKISWKFDEDPPWFSWLASFGTWRTLRVQDWGLGGKTFIWHHRSCW